MALCLNSGLSREDSNWIWAGMVTWPHCECMCALTDASNADSA